MVKVPLEYKIAQEVLEECFSTYLVHFPQGLHLEPYTKDALHLIIKGFVIGKGYNWRQISYTEVQEILYNMIATLFDRRDIKEADPDYAWLRHVRQQFASASYLTTMREKAHFTIQ